MPQMSPMNWLTLFMMFIIIFMIYNTLNYYSFLYTPKNMKSYTTKKSIYWKW